MTHKRPRCPRGLKTNEAKKLWREVWEDFDLDIAGEVILKTACFSLDEYLTCNQLIKEQGYTFESESGVVRKNPLFEVVRVSRSAFLQSMKELNLVYEEPEKNNVGRPFTLVK